MNTTDPSDLTEDETLTLRDFLAREADRRAARVAGRVGPPHVGPLFALDRSRPTVRPVAFGVSALALVATAAVALVASAGLRATGSATTQVPARGPATAPTAAACASSQELHAQDGLALLGSAPVTLSMAAADGTAYFERPEGARWSAIEAIWSSDPGFTGTVKVRGRQLDGSGQLRFGDPVDPLQELVFSQVQTSGLVAGRPILSKTEIRIQVPGCYEVTIEAGAVTTGIVFRAAPIGDAFAAVTRPLNLPEAASTCSPTPHSGSAEAVGELFGDGPVYLTGGTTMSLADASRPGGYSLLQQTWLVADSDLGPVLVRGARIDEAGELRFGPGDAPSSELRLPIKSYEHTPGQPPGWRMFNQYVRLPGPGCYGLQIDTLSSSETLIVRADP